MPSIKMKTESTMGCLKGKNGLRVCRKSTMISKNLLCHNGISKIVENIYSCAQNNKDALVSRKAHFKDLEDKWTDNDELSSEKLSQKQPSTLSDSRTDSLEPMSSTFPSNMDTIFSPILESIDFYSNEGSDSLCVAQLDTEDSENSSRSSCEIQACNVSDFYISDMIFSGSPIGCTSELENKIETAFLSDYKCEESSLVCDLKEDFMILPFLEDAVEAECNHDNRPSQVAVMGTDNSSFYMAINQLRSDNHDSYLNSYPDQDYDCFDPQLYIRSLPDQPDMTCSLLPRPVPNEKLSVKRITLALDLDETLVHSTVDPCCDTDFTFTVLFNMKEHVIYVKQRPHLQIFLKRVAEMFDVVVFTASQSIYAKQILDILDPDGIFISRRAYRESCIFLEGSYMKDLTVLGVDLAKVAIIDNSPQVFKLQVNNGIPIKSWFNDPSDSALILLLPFLETLVDADDVRPIIARKFGNKEEKLPAYPY